MSGSASTLPYLGSKISLISYAGIRYEGVLFNINTRESTVGLSNVRSFGTEGRKPGGEIPPSDDTFDYIVFRGKDIQDLTVSEPANHPEDPAIVAINPGPPMGMGHHDFGGRGGFGGGFGRNMGGGNHGGPHHNGNGGYHGGMGGGGGGGGGFHGSYPRREGGMGGRGRGGYNGGYSGGYNPRTIVGELRPQPNQTLKSQLEAAFDFEEGNRRFEKTALHPTDNADGAGENGKENEATGTPVPKGGYNREASFFDTISCEALDRQSGVDTRVDRQKQRVLDAATFGTSANLPMRRGGRGYRRTNYRRNNAAAGNQGNNGGNPNHPGAGNNAMNHFPQVGYSAGRY